MIFFNTAFSVVHDGILSMAKNCNIEARILGTGLSVHPVPSPTPFFLFAMPLFASSHAAFLLSLSCRGVWADPFPRFLLGPMDVPSRRKNVPWDQGT